MDRAPGLAARTLFGLGWGVVASGAQALLSLGIVMILSRLLTPADFGLLAIALAFVALANIASQRCIGPALVQRHALGEGHVSTGLTLSLGLGILLAAALFILAPAAARVLGEPQLAPVLRALAPVPILGALAVASEHLLRRHLRFGPLMAATVASHAIGSGLVAVALALLGYGVWALVWGVLARYATFALIVLACRPPPLRLRIARGEAAELLRTGAGFSAISLLNTVSWHGAHLGIAWTLGAAALGLYSRAERLARVPATLSPVLNDVLFSAMSRRQHHAERLEAVLLNGAEMLLLAALPAGLAIAVAAPEIVAVVLGGQWEAAVPAVRILALGGALQVGSALHVAVIRARGAVYRETWRRALYFVLLPACVWAGSRWGLAGIAAGVAGAGIVLHLLLVQLSLSQLGGPWRRLLRCHLPGVWASVWATPVLWLALRLARDASLPELVSLSASRVQPGRRPWPRRSAWHRDARNRGARAGRWDGCRSASWAHPDGCSAPCSRGWRGWPAHDRPAQGTAGRDRCRGAPRSGGAPRADCRERTCR